jgi:hypothetical protein
LLSPATIPQFHERKTLMQIQEAIEAVRRNPDAAQQAQNKLQQMLARSAVDPAFRAQLLTAPHVAMSEFLGKPVADLGVVFIENKADATIVLPDLVDLEAQLSEADLETVAGGGTPVIVSVLWIAAELIDALE